MKICVHWPAPPQNTLPILPVFLPFSGCPQRCIFCAQETQSGTAARAPHEALRPLQVLLDTRHAHHASPVELGFFGGTFTALPPEDVNTCLEFVRRERRRGTVCRARCSTRPDAVDPARLARLTEAGFTTVELGVQSFYTPALEAARRGYPGERARAACEGIRDAGLSLGVQFLPGMPGVNGEIFLEDVRIALRVGANVLRFYPCLVMQDTPLADMWRQGAYTPWTLEETLPVLAQGWRMAARAGVRVIRMGLAPEEGLQGRVLAGPQHSALGAQVQAMALLMAVEEALRARGFSRMRGIVAPQHCQGFFWGHGGNLRPRWESWGLTAPSVRWHTASTLHLEVD